GTEKVWYLAGIYSHHHSYRIVRTTSVSAARTQQTSGGVTVSNRISDILRAGLFSTGSVGLLQINISPEN
ncbi:hypothetical protein ACK1NQ_005074, partial [Salmonella enterica]